MPKYHVARSTHINATPDEVFDVVADFSRWSTWSPWLCCEPDAEVVVSDDPSSVGSTYKWNGELVGEGEIEHVTLTRGKLLEEELRFLRPFTSQAKVTFELSGESDGTKLTWNMYGSLPWFLFFMKSAMQSFIGMDYERGLRMLKEKIETGEVQSKTTIRGVESVDAIDLLGVHKSCAMKDIGPSMESALGEVKQLFDDAGMDCADAELTLTAYHKWDLKNQSCEYTSGVSVDDPSQSGPSLTHYAIPAGKALCVEHIGKYEHLGNAWSAAHQYLRYKKLKQAKVAAFEIYRNSPDDTSPGELKTEIYLPLR